MKWTVAWRTEGWQSLSLPGRVRKFRENPKQLSMVRQLFCQLGDLALTLGFLARLAWEVGWQPLLLGKKRKSRGR